MFLQNRLSRKRDSCMVTRYNLQLVYFDGLPKMFASGIIDPTEIPVVEGEHKDLRST